MNIIDDLRSKHRELSNLVATLLLPDASATAHAEELREQLDQLADMLVEHVANEHPFLAELCAAPLGTIQRLAGDARRHEANALMEHFQFLARRWSVPGEIERDPVAFHVAILVLRGSLDRLIWRDENDVYPPSVAAWEPKSFHAAPLTGIRELDEDHDEMFAVISGLRAVISAGITEVDSGQVAALSAYAERHFEREEALMGATQYAGLDDHRQEHHRARTILLGFRNDYLDGRRIGADAVLSFLENWMASHIAGTDLRMAEHLTSVGGLPTLIRH